MMNLSILIMVLSIFLFCFLTNSLLLIWSSLLLSSLATLTLMKTQPKMITFKYFCIQEIATLFFFMSLFPPLLKILPIMMLMLKIGLPPFQSWIIEIFHTIKSSVFIWTLNIAKIIPTLMVISLLTKKMLSLILLTFIFSQILVIPYMSNMKLVILISSLSNISFILLTSLWSMYFSITFLLMYIITSTTMMSPLNNLKWNHDTTPILLIFNFSGIPPSILFFLKIQSVFLLSKFNPMMTIIIIISTLPFYFSYMKIIENQMNTSMFFPNTSNYKIMLQTNKWLLTDFIVIFMILLMT